jgi:hypothetical protein
MKQFDVIVEFVGHNPARDQKILRSLEPRDRRLFTGSGFSLFDDVRDMSFSTCKPEIAERLKNNLRKVLKNKHIRGSVRIWSENEQSF